MSAPEFPIRRVFARFDRKSGRFLPCRDSDSRATLIMSVDALGRSVMTVEARPFAAEGGTTGWMLCEPTMMQNPEEFRVWMQSNPKLEVVK